MGLSKKWIGESHVTWEFLLHPDNSKGAISLKLTHHRKEIRREQMPQRLIELTSHYPELLSSLAKSHQKAPYTIIEREGRYYLSFSDSDDLMSVQKAEQSADVLLSNINAMLRLPPFRVTNPLKRTGEVITLDENGRPITKTTHSFSTRFGLSPDFTTVDFSNFMEIVLKASRLSRIKQALRYYADGSNWFNLYDVYETIKKDCEELTGIGIPSQWTTDTRGRNRLKDFTESANNAFISGYAARHTFAQSYEIEQISADRVKLKDSGEEITPMSLSEAREFTESLLVQWLKSRGIRF